MEGGVRGGRMRGGPLPDVLKMHIRSAHCGRHRPIPAAPFGGEDGGGEAPLPPPRGGEGVGPGPPSGAMSSQRVTAFASMSKTRLDLEHVTPRDPK